MTTDTKLLPLPQWTQYNAHLRILANSLQRRVQDYARANMAPLIAEIEGLRAEAAKLRNLRADAIHECALANARAERLAEALREIEAIEDKMDGGDWDEIETARKIARAALHPTAAQADEAAPLPAAGGAFSNEVTP